ncbi:MAG: DUF3109 family protein [bacterium]|nr:DUF3109 family protein [bacterium]
MILIGKILVSAEIIEKRFSCNILECRGRCCCEGYGGAPLEPSEVPVLEEILPMVSKYLRKSSIEKIKDNGPWCKNIWGGFEILLDDIGWCVFAVEKDGIIRCAIEAAWQDKNIAFKKPISCHLYPIRIRKFGFFEGLVYERWDICRYNTDQEAPLLYEFASDALERKYGNEFVEKLRNLKYGHKE